MATTIETYIDCLGIDLEDLYEMSAEERETFYKNAIRDLSDEELQELEQAYKDALDYLADELFVYQSLLNDIISSGNSTTEEIARAERALDDIDDLFEFTEEESTNFGAAQTEVAEEYIDATNGESTTFTPTDPDNGQEYVIDATATETDDDTGLGEEYDANYGVAGYVDHDGDSGTALIDADTDDNGYADVDTNSDGQITELDMLDADEQPSDQYISLNVDGTVELASYDSVTGDTRWKVTTENEDGETITYYITVKGFANIRFTGDYTMVGDDIKTTWGDELLNRCYDGSSSESFGDVMGVGYSNPEIEEYYTIINMADHNQSTSENEVEITPSADDFVNGRNYEITCADDSIDNLILNFPEDATVVFSTSEDGEGLLITVTNADGDSITITIYDFGPSSDTEYDDTISIPTGEIDYASASSRYLGSAEDGREFWVD